jgi:hypothetical protein
LREEHFLVERRATFLEAEAFLGERERAIVIIYYNKRKKNKK